MAQPPARPADVGDVYDLGAGGYDARAQAPATAARFARMERGLLTHTGPGVAVLEVGVGTGRLLARCGGRRRVGVDVSRGLLRQARAKGLAVARADAHRLPFPNGSFDVVCAGNGVWRYLDGAAALREARRVLRPGGVLFIHTYARSTWRPRGRGGDKPASHRHIDSVADVLEPAGALGFTPLSVDRFRPVRVWPYALRVPAWLPGRWWSHVAFLLRAPR